MRPGRWWAGLLLTCAGAGMGSAGLAQTTPNPPGMNETRLGRDFRVEKEALGACKQFSFGSLMDCGQTLVMGQPMHISVGSLAPDNGVAAGIAFVEHTDFKNEVRASYDLDAVGALNGSWRAGGYLKAYRVLGGNAFGAAPLLSAYSQSISLKRVDFYGLGPNSSRLNKTTFGFAENVTGVSLVFPSWGSWQRVGLAISGEMNGRFPVVRGGSESTIPSIETVFNNASAPGLARQAIYFQTAEGVRWVPHIPKNPVRLNYFGQFAQYTAPSNPEYTFRRMNLDFNHVIPLYQVMRGRARSAYDQKVANGIAHNGPDDCGVPAHATEAMPCPAVALTDKLEGAITLRAFISESIANRGSVVPFYFQPTIGGSDLNGTAMLASYPDYRFRGPDLLLFQGTIEHSLGKLPVGVLFSVDEGKIGLRRDDVSLHHLRHTFTVGLTVHAGGLPVAHLLFAWGGNEGNHTTADVESSLLGGGGRPSLF